MKSSNLSLYTRSTFEGVGFTLAFVLIACTSEFGTQLVAEATANAGPRVERIAIDAAALADEPVAVGPVTDAAWFSDAVATIPREFEFRGPFMRRYDVEAVKRPIPAHNGARYYARADL